jgi:hypothetical protein
MPFATVAVAVADDEVDGLIIFIIELKLFDKRASAGVPTSISS